MLKYLLNVVCFVTLFTSVANADDLTADLSRDKVPLGETFELILTYNGQGANNAQPDFSVLRQNFDIYSNSTSLQTSFINGQGSVQRQWRIGLMPKQTGVLTVPAIKIGQYSSKPLNIEVLPAGSVAPTNKSTNSYSSAAENLSATMDIAIDENNPYVQQEINAVLTIDDNKGIEFTTEPQLMSNADDWIIKTLRTPTVEGNGHGGRIIKFYYALFPQKSGKQQIPAFQIDGFYTSFEEQRMPTSSFGGMMNFFNFDMSGMFGVRKPIKLVTNPQNVEVRPIAADYGNSWWLPSTAVGVASRWVDDKPQFKVGETVAREIVFAAEGVADTQMPEIELESNPDIRQYPEKPEVEAIADNNKVTSQIKMRIVYIPQVSGKQTIPEISIPWFNVNTGRKETAVIDAVTINVAEAPLGTMTDSQQASLANKQQTKENVDIPLVEKNINNFVQWVWLVIAFVAGLLLSFAILRKKTPQIQHDNNADLSSIRQSLRQKDYRQLRDNLLGFGRQFFTHQNINNLNDLSECVNDTEFTKQMKLLNGILYANETEELNDEIIMSALKKCCKSATKKEDKPLPELYK